jgi:hypothetical protein
VCVHTSKEVLGVHERPAAGQGELKVQAANERLEGGEGQIVLSETSLHRGGSRTGPSSQLVRGQSRHSACTSVCVLELLTGRGVLS